MTPTHILVPIEDYNAIKEMCSDYDCNHPEFTRSIPVDLSEESIKAKAEKHVVMNRDKYSMCGWYYEQCAKDLLNTKP